MSDGAPITMTFGEYDWSAIQRALYDAAGDLAASEARRTGGRGMASGGKERQLQRMHRIQDEIRDNLRGGAPASGS